MNRIINRSGWITLSVSGYKILCGFTVCLALGPLTAGAQEPTSRLQDDVLQRPVLPPPMPESGEPQVSNLFDQLSGRPAEVARTDAQMLRIATYDDRGTPWMLSRGQAFELEAMASGGEAAAWWVAPVATGSVRIQTYENGRVYAVSAQSGGRASLMPLAQDPRQLWRVVGAGRVANRFLLESVQYPGLCLSHVGGGRMAIQAINFAPMQMWMPFAIPPAAAFQPFYRTIHHEILANAPLPPAQLELFNSHRYALIVLLGDRRRGDAFEQIRIDPNSSQTISLHRDSGATIVETVEIRSPLGFWERQQLVTAVPPAAYYDLSVYEEHLQSIAIDRTGKSPNPIEDVNYVPKSVGWLPLPAGSELPDRGRLDVYSRAKSANNPGAVRRLDFKQFDKAPRENPLESILQEFQSAPRRSF